MKHVKKILAFALTLVMAFGFALTAYAEQNTNGNRTVDEKISVTGFESGDTVKAYQFITWNNGWVLKSGITGIDINDIAGKESLTKEQLATLASQTDKMTEVTGTLAGGTWEKPCGNVTTAGSYLILVTSGTAKYIYNPVVVSADFDGTVNAVDLTSATAAFKKQEITVDKVADNANANNNYDDYDVQVGDIVPFTVTVTVPQYNDNWTNPYFAVSDRLSDGLTINTIPTIEGLTEGEDYTLTDGPNDNGVVEIGDKAFTITFLENYLKENASTAVEIKYSALVGEAVKDTAQVHEETNKVTLEFSNNPSNSSDHKTVDDETHHYTFAIDANRFGSSTTKTGELIKVGVDDDGNPITKYIEGAALPEKVSALAGAEFTLTGTGPNGTGTVTRTATSDSNGRVAFNNLEAGSYKLQETKAPDGYIRDTTEHTVIITAEYNQDSTLKNYSIKIDNEDIATYSVTTKTDGTLDTVATPTDGNNSFPINNKQGTELPSTGGIGTTIFYVVGGIMVAGAAIFLLTKRRAASAE